MMKNNYSVKYTRLMTNLKKSSATIFAQFYHICKPKTARNFSIFLVLYNVKDHNGSQSVFTFNLVAAGCQPGPSSSWTLLAYHTQIEIQT
jgi:hypothetical protein